VVQPHFIHVYLQQTAPTFFPIVNASRHCITKTRDAVHDSLYGSLFQVCFYDSHHIASILTVIEDEKLEMIALEAFTP
jgi:hypothetical protein